MMIFETSYEVLLANGNYYFQREDGVYLPGAIREQNTTPEEALYFMLNLKKNLGRGKS